MERVVPATYLGGVVVHGAWNGAATLPFIYPGDTQMATVSWAALGIVLVTCLALVRELLRRGVAYDAPASNGADVKDEPREEGDDEDNSGGGDDELPDETWAPPEP